MQSSFWSANTYMYNTKLKGIKKLPMFCVHDGVTAGRFTRLRHLNKVEVDGVAPSEDALNSHPLALEPAWTMLCLDHTNTHTYTHIWTWMEGNSYE